MSIYSDLGVGLGVKLEVLAAWDGTERTGNVSFALGTLSNGGDGEEDPLLLGPATGVPLPEAV